jgi:hypothetical protein
MDLTLEPYQIALANLLSLPPRRGRSGAFVNVRRTFTPLSGCADLSAPRREWMGRGGAWI